MVAMMGSPRTAENLGQLSGLVDLLTDPKKAKAAIAEMEAQIKELRKLKAELDAGRKQLDKDRKAFEAHHTELHAQLEQKQHYIDGLEGGLAQRETALRNGQAQLDDERNKFRQAVNSAEKGHRDVEAALTRMERMLNEGKQAFEAKQREHEARVKADQDDIAKQRRSLQVERTKLKNLADDVAAREKDHAERVKQLKQIIG